MAESKAPWPKLGVAGKVQPAKRAAPAGASDLQILVVAHTAWKEGRDVEDVWREVADGD